MKSIFKKLLFFSLIFLIFSVKSYCLSIHVSGDCTFMRVHDTGYEYLITIRCSNSGGTCFTFSSGNNWWNLTTYGSACRPRTSGNGDMTPKLIKLPDGGKEFRLEKQLR